MEKVETYSFGFSLDTQEIWLIMGLAALALCAFYIYDSFMIKKKLENREVATKKELEAASASNLALLSNQLKECKQTSLLDYAKQLKASRKALDKLLTHEIISVTPINKFYKLSGKELGKNKISDSYLVILSGNGYNMYGMVITISAGKYLVTVKDEIYLPFKQDTYGYKFKSFDTVDEIIEDLIDTEKRKMEDEFMVLCDIKYGVLDLSSEAKIKDDSDFNKLDIKSITVFMR